MNPDSAPLRLAFLSGFFGFLLGATIYATWQDAVESAQVVAGLIPYPPTNPLFIYHTKTWTFLHQIPALLLRLGLSEITLSIAISGFIGMLSFQALSLISYSFCRHFLFAFFIPFFILFTQSYAFHTNYPIILMGYQYTYGAAGLSWLILALAWIAVGRPGIGGFLVGLAPGIHVILGVFASLILGIASLVHRFSREERKRLWISWLAGISICAASYLAHEFLTDPRPFFYPPSHEIKPYIETLIRYWDIHRMPVELSNVGVQLNILAFFAGILSLRFLKLLSPYSKFLIKCLIISAALGGIGGVISCLPPEKFSPWILSTMPSRLLNINGFAFVAIILSVAWSFRHRALGVLASLFFVVFFISVRYLHNDEFLYFFKFLAACGLLFIFLTLYGLLSKKKNWMELGQIGVLVLLLGTAFKASAPLPVTREDAFENRENVAFLKTVAERHGMLAPAADLTLFQMQTRRPILMVPQIMDILPYAPGAGPAMVEILKEVYGIDFFNPPVDPGNRHFISVSAAEMQSLKIWQERSKDEWQKIAGKFGFKDVLISKDYALDLPLVLENEGYRLYEVPAK